MTISVDRLTFAEYLNYTDGSDRRDELVNGELISTKATDYRAKRSEYSILDIAEYWIIDPLLMKVTVFTLDEGWYEPAEFEGEDLIRSSIFPALQLSLDRIIVKS